MASAAVALRPAGVRAVGWGWRHAGRRAAALSDLDLSIEPGERVLLLGASGAGKSTLLAGLAGVLGGDEDGEAAGELLVDGMPAERARGRVGLVVQDPDASVILSAVGDDVAFGCENLGVPRDEIWPRVRAALDAVGLHLALDHPTARLSGGQKQRLALAGALAMAPGLLLLDEPTANLDPDGVEEVRDAVGRAVERTGATLVVVEHRVAVWSPLVDRVVVLSAAGGVLADGSPDAVLASRGAELATAGVWVPGHPPTVPAPTSRGTGEPLLLAEHLAIGRRPTEVVRDQLDFRVSAARMLAVTGPNGSGKSTLALTVGGLMKPLGGTLTATASLENGAGTSPARWKSRQLLTRIGSVFQNPEHQFLAATVSDELAIGPRALGVASDEIERRVDEVLERLGLARLARANPFTLSGGEKRRLSVGTAIATRPRLLVLDEPTFGQDSRTWSEIVALLSALLDDGAGVMAITHDREFVAALGGDILSLDRARAGVAR